jgi:CubicO group peptidase (beta-lactamase class C family)
VASGASPSAVAALGTVDGSRTVAHGAVVSHQGHQRPTASVSYDIASLTKVVATWPLTGLAVVSGALDLDEPVGTYFDQPSLPGTAESGLRWDPACPVWIRPGGHDHLQGQEPWCQMGSPKVL